MKLITDLVIASVITFTFALLIKGFSLQGYILVGEFLRDKVGINIFYFDYGNSMIVFYGLIGGIVLLWLTKRKSRLKLMARSSSRR